jgi:hypothetical protein
MPLSLLQSIVRTCVAATTPTRRRRSAAGLRSREATMGLESLEQRMALTVAATSIRLAAASDTGADKTDGYTNVARPVFIGKAPPRSLVVVSVDGNRLGAATSTARGDWRLATPANRSFASGTYTITASASTKAQALSTATPLPITVDRTAPTARLDYDTINGRATLTFSEPVSGVQLRNLFISGRTSSGVTLASVPIKDSRAQFFVGAITFSQSPDRKTYTFQQQLVLAESGNYTLVFLRTGVTDRAGNPLAAGAATRFRII